jgi:cation diffusion facilitator CzcD-associated flavoprotein CzcO
VRLTVDGRQVDGAGSLVYRGLMFSGVPNLALATGYTNASWTLKCELAARYVCRLLNHMQARGQDCVVPVADAEAMAATQPFLNLSSGYIQRASAELPRQGMRTPWRMYQNYLLDLLSLKFSPLEDGVLRFGKRQARG